MLSSAISCRSSICPGRLSTAWLVSLHRLAGTVMDGQIKLTRLLQYTCGSAKAAIRNCAVIGGESGYNQARDILHNRYGNVHLVSQKIVTELKTGKRVMKPQDLQQLADELLTREPSDF